ncbi:hypothetical protein [Rickettsia asembonensis]|uniref:Uncharacterized protein n=1 Tax=Rickettsia asembonensis TaxID=1068590 RepID=A0A0C2LZC8_9RICK|nr:hypothetical protein [Rickettsia asembonensis]KIJ88757.1 hypothetical protein SB78_03745 [Rickettsia asembonensis]
MDTKSSLQAAIGCAAIHKKLKKFCKSEFFTRLLHQNLQFFFVMMKKTIHATTPLIPIKIFIRFYIDE